MAGHLKKHPINGTDDHIGVIGAVLDNIMTFDSNALPQDSGSSIADLALATHSHAINDLTDVTITTPADNEVLAYDFTSGEFINQTPAEAGLSAAGHTHIAVDVTDFQVTVSANTDVANNTLLAHTQNTDQYLDFGGANQSTALEIRNFIDSKAANNGLAPLDAGGIVPAIHLPASILGALNYIGTWNATTNAPVLGTGGAGGNQGDYYVVSVAGTTSIDGNADWQVGDWLTHNGTIWEKVDNTDKVSSVNGQTGTVVLDTDDIAEGVTNLYYTETRVSNNVDVANNTANNHIQNSDTQLRSGLIDTSSVGEMKIKVYIQASQPVLSANNMFAFWLDSDDANRAYIIFRRGISDHVLVELAP